MSSPKKNTPTNRPITQRQGKVLDFIVSYTHRNGYPPSRREIGEAFKIKSVNGVNDHLLALTRKGYITQKPGLSRAITVTRVGLQTDHGAGLLIAVNAELRRLNKQLVKQVQKLERKLARLEKKA